MQVYKIVHVRRNKRYSMLSFAKTFYEEILHRVPLEYKKDTVTYAPIGSPIFAFQSLEEATKFLTNEMYMTPSVKCVNGDITYGERKGYNNGHFEIWKAEFEEILYVAYRISCGSPRGTVFGNWLFLREKVTNLSVIDSECIYTKQTVHLIKEVN